MTSKQKLGLVLPLLLVFLNFSCNQAKFVPSGKHLYQIKKKHILRKSENSTIHFKIVKDSLAEFEASHHQIEIEDLYDLLKPQPNRKFNLFVYNRIDTLKMQNQIEKKRVKIIKKNNKRIAKQNEINRKRNDKAKRDGNRHYYKKKIKLKKERKGWRYWVTENVGEPPVIMDSMKVAKTAEQLNLYLKKRGFYENSVSYSIVYNSKKKKAYPLYVVGAGKPITISTLAFDQNKKYALLAGEYKTFLRKSDQLIYSGDLLDEDKLDLERQRFSKYCRDNAFFNFSKNYIYFQVDTTTSKYQADVKIQVIPRTKELENGIIETLPHTTYKVDDVTYYVHNRNKESFKDFEAYKARLEEYGENIVNGNYPLLDTLYYLDKVIRKKFVIFGKVDTLTYQGTFVYNEELPVSPFLLNHQNFLEITDGGDNGWYKEYYVERSYSRLLGLDIFGSITPDIRISDAGPRRLSVSYDLVPSNKQIFSIEPNLTNSNGFLGLAASVNYTNKNIFGGAEKLKISVVGGAESQPAIFDRTIDGESIKRTDRQFNTIEIYPKITLEFPRLLPMSKRVQKTLGKRLYPSTVLDLSYNFQKRTDFTRNLTEFAYGWKFNEGKSKIHNIKWQSFNFVKMDKSDEFLEQLAQLNDPFLINTYNDHFSNKFEYIFQYNNQRVQNENGKKNYVFGTATAGTSGFLFDQIGIGENDTTDIGLKKIVGVPFTQFVNLDFDVRYYMDLNKLRPNKQVIAYRLLAGAGYAYGNSPSLPYEESFFAGGSNDIRAFTARTMAPGGTQTWADTNSANTQVADMRLELNVEYRFEISSLIKAAIFADAGNIWKIDSDGSLPEDDLGVFRLETAGGQIALGAGLGLRLDFEFFVVRLDLAVPIHNPYMYQGERWIWEERSQYKTEVEDLPATYVEALRGPFRPNLNFGIGYPF
ncbi:MAG: BamA/TamA family outer membrane protein [Crocinitomicaceae bacterium]